MALVERGIKKFGLMKQETPNQRLRLIRELLQFNQTQFSKALGFKQSHISAVEGEKKEVSVKIIYALVNKFKVSANWLLSGNGEMFLTHHDKVEFTSQEPAEIPPKHFTANSSAEAETTTGLEQNYYLNGLELRGKIEELESAIINEGYKPLFHLCELFSVLLKLPLDFSILQKFPIPDTSDVPAQALSPLLERNQKNTHFDQQVAYYTELEKVFKAWRLAFHEEFQKLYEYLTQPESNEVELKSRQEVLQHTPSQQQVRPDQN